MKPDWPHLERYRDTKSPMASPRGAHYGRFKVSTGPRGSERLLIIACEADTDPTSPAFGWEHVSVSAWTPSVHKQAKPIPRCPTWEEMDRVKHYFWDDEETVLQYHPPESVKVNFAPNCLHLWKYTLATTPVPPSILVGL